MNSFNVGNVTIGTACSAEKIVLVRFDLISMVSRKFFEGKLRNS